MKEEQRFKESIVMLGEIFDKKITPGILKIYWEIFSQYSDDDFFGAVDAHMHKGRFFPRPADLIELITGTSTANAHEAWGEVLQQLKDVRTASFDLITAKAVQALGGSDYLGHLSYHELEFKKNNFIELYESLAERSDAIGIENRRDDLLEEDDYD